MRWFVVAALGVVGLLGVAALYEPRVEGATSAPATLALPTQFAPPSDPRADDAVLRLAFSVDLQSAHAATLELARENRLANAWRDERALGSLTAGASPVALPEPSFAALAACAALFVGALRRRARRQRAGSPDATHPLLPRWVRSPPVAARGDARLAR